ncbi:NAD(P)-binding protein [Xylaria cf. heliscus]|nr:NAD(P)-binding protein [Xylaria cf. heliscus]
MDGTIIFTGANSSLGIPTVERILARYPKLHIVLTVRDASSNDPNTQKLQDVVSRYPNSHALIRRLDLGDLAAVGQFVQEISESIAKKQYPPLKAIICCAMYWDLINGPELTTDGYDKTFQICHIAHVALILPLLSSFGPGKGRIVMFSSGSHWPGKSMMETYPPTIPDDLTAVLTPAVTDDNYGSGFLRYSNSKLAITMWMHALNRHLQHDTNLRRITAVTFNPGQLVDSRGLRTRTPRSTEYMQKLVFQPFAFLLRYVDQTMRSSDAAASDLVEVALSPQYADASGYFEMLKNCESSPESRDSAKQDVMWIKSAEWARVTASMTVLGSTFK